MCTITQKVFVLGSSYLDVVYQDDIFDVSNFGGGDLNFKVTVGCYV